jgi:uncharacterized protein YozE (UPF0346 family)
MSEKLSFTAWLLLQTGSHDPVGDLASDAKDDDTWPEGERDFQTYDDYLSDLGAMAEARDALRRAWDEWRVA